MNQLTNLVLQASLPNSLNPREKWELAVQICPIESWPGEVSRLVPCFYVTHGSQLALENDSLLRGVYKSNWSRNSLNLKAIIPILSSLDSQSIEYRLIKGAAIILYLNQIGARRMGDLDLIVNQSNRNSVKNILKSEGFYARYPGDRRSNLSEIWENIDGVVLDLHYIKKYDLYQCVFTDLIKKDFLGYKFKLPSYEVSILVAAYHGNLGHSGGDLPQSIWDIAMIRKFANLESLNLLVLQNRQSELMKSISGYFDVIESDLKSLDKTPGWLRLKSVITAWARSIFRRITSISKPKIWNGANLTFSGGRKALFLNHEFLYFFWACFGMIRPLERFFVLQFGRLLPNRKLAFQVSNLIALGKPHWFLVTKHFSVRSYFRNEIRVELPAPPKGMNKLDIEIDLEIFTPRMLFIDGIGFGHLTPGLGNRYGFWVDSRSDHHELSFRDFSLDSNPWVGKMTASWSQIEGH